jgi:hypothetical protein
LTAASNCSNVNLACNNRPDDDLAVKEQHFDNRIILYLCVGCKRLWDSQGKAVAPFMNFCAHHASSIVCIYKKDTLIVSV